jgi:hypothetical protein
MCEEHKKAKSIIKDRILRGGEFTYPEISKEIIKGGGIMRVSLGVTVNDYLETLEKRGVVHYNPRDDKFVVRGFSK